MEQVDLYLWYHNFCSATGSPLCSKWVQHEQHLGMPTLLVNPERCMVRTGQCRSLWEAVHHEGLSSGHDEDQQGLWHVGHHGQGLYPMMYLSLQNLYAIFQQVTYVINAVKVFFNHCIKFILFDLIWFYFLLHSCKYTVFW